MFHQSHEAEQHATLLTKLQDAKTRFSKTFQKSIGQPKSKEIDLFWYTSLEATDALAKAKDALKNYRNVLDKISHGFYFYVVLRTVYLGVMTVRFIDCGMLAT